MGSKDKAHQPPPLKAASVVLVEDQIFVQDLMERMLTGHVGQLHTARSAEDAFYNLEKNPGLAHVLIVDFGLPGIDGIRFIEKVRAAKSEKLRKIPVVMLTGNNDMDLYRRAARLGIAAFLVKPVGATTLIETLEAALAGRKVPIPRLDGNPAPPSEAPPVRRRAEPAQDEAEPQKQPAEPAAPPPHPIDFKA
jgi:CheY-like chemotaxis protein